MLGSKDKKPMTQRTRLRGGQESIKSEPSSWLRPRGWGDAFWAIVSWSRGRKKGSAKLPKLPLFLLD